MTIAVVSSSVISPKQMPASDRVSAFLYFLLWKSSSLDVVGQQVWDLGSWLVDTWRERIPRSRRAWLGAPLELATGNLHVRAPGIPLADNGEFVMELQQKQVKAKDFRGEL